MSKSPEKPRIGRPPLENPLRKRFFRCTDEEWRLIQAAAADGNRSRFIRETVMDAAKRKLTKRSEI